MTTPNVVLILTDDEKFAEVQDGFLRADIEAMKAAGMWFPRYQVVRAVCGPSRGTYITGQYAQNDLVTGLAFGSLDKTNLLFKWLWGTATNRRVQTGFIGKFCNDYDASGLNRVKYATPAGIDHWRAFNNNGANEHPQVRVEDYNADGTLAVPGSFYPASGSAMTEWSTDYVRMATAELVNLFLNRDPGDPRHNLPFFLQICPTAPHQGAGSASVLPGDQFGRTARLASYNTWVPPFFVPGTAPPNIDLSQTANVASSSAAERGRMKALIGADDILSEVTNQLDDASVLDNTLIIYTSDNGWANGENDDWSGKDSIYDAVMKVPLVIRGPGITAGVTNNARITNVDMAPTIAAWFGITPGLACDGVDFRPAINDETILDDRVVLLTATPQSGRGYVKGFAGVMTKNWKYARFYNTSPTSADVPVLFDLVADPYEMNNLFDNPAYATKQAELESLLVQMVSCSGESCHLGYTEPYIPPVSDKVFVKKVSDGTTVQADVEVFDNGAVRVAIPFDDPTTPTEPGIYVER